MDILHLGLPPPLAQGQALASKPQARPHRVNMVLLPPLQAQSLNKMARSRRAGISVEGHLFSWSSTR